ncbi:hypothetical protein COP2_028392 [Malus domestica]
MKPNTSGPCWLLCVGGPAAFVVKQKTSALLGLLFDSWPEDSGPKACSKPSFVRMHHSCLLPQFIHFSA